MAMATRCCAACAATLEIKAFSKSQLLKEQAKCRSCVAAALTVATAELARTKRCVQCFQDLPRDRFSKRQYQQLDSKCVDCVEQLERSATSDKWSYDCYYRVCHRGRAGGVNVRSRFHIASPIVGSLPLGRVFRASDVLCNEQGDAMVKLASLSCLAPASDGNEPSGDRSRRAAPRDGWVPCRSIRNEVLLERHAGPWRRAADDASPPRFYRCVVEGCKARAAPDLALSEIGYVLYGDVVEVVACELVAPDGLVFLRLHDRYFDGPAWVVERSLDNESVLNRVRGPSTRRERYRCVQPHGAPLRHEPTLAATPVDRVPCGAVVDVVERVVTAERQVFLRLESWPPLSGRDVWVIETSSVCASVMIRVVESDSLSREDDTSLL
ncbi:hypothetical protein P43SY_006457 [Pythium insidiosum]|uniref:Uncharacterized protein n=1 Tax=Pythium insidiosum TaxID=114742 RepID=A0AAD5M8G8_PYTIN|nr:hypothetical protein P43SY_006457 [Pythium insidiosum]